MNNIHLELAGDVFNFHNKVFSFAQTRINGL